MRDLFLSLEPLVNASGSSPTDLECAAWMKESTPIQAADHAAQWVTHWAPGHVQSVLLDPVQRLIRQFVCLETALPPPRGYSFVSKEGVGLLRPTKDPVQEIITMDMALLRWFQILESLLDFRPNTGPLGAARPRAFTHLWCHLLAVGGPHRFPALPLGGALWSAFQSLLGLWSMELACRNGSMFWRQ